MAGLNNFDIVSLADRENQKAAQRHEQMKSRALQATQMSTSILGTILGAIIPPVGIAISAAGSAATGIAGAVSKSVDSARASLNQRDTNPRLNGM